MGTYIHTEVSYYCILRKVILIDCITILFQTLNKKGKKPKAIELFS